jgi:hypothetical protein
VSQLRGGLSDEKFEAFEQEVIWTICLEWPTENHRLQRSTVRERLVGERRRGSRLGNARRLGALERDDAQVLTRRTAEPR